MTLPDQNAPYFQHLREEGVRYTEVDLQPNRRGQTGALPDKATVKALSNAVQVEFNESHAARQDWVVEINNAWRDYDLTSYDPEQVQLAEMDVVRRPLTRSRCEQARTSLFASLALEPFATAEVDDGEPGEVAHHSGLALSEQLRNAEWPNTLSDVLLGAVVAGTGVIKDKVVEGHSRTRRIDAESVDVRDLYLSPHNVRDLEQCTMIAHRFYEPARWVRDMALMGIFDVDAAKDVAGKSARDLDDGGSTDRLSQGLYDNDGVGSEESGTVELLEAFIRWRRKPDEEAQMWRVTCVREGFRVLRADKWEDGFPFTLVRVLRSGTTVWGKGFPNILRDSQYAGDMLWSASLEGDMLAVAPFFEVDEMSPAGKMLKARQAKAGGAVRVRPGDIWFRRGQTEAIRPIHMNPTPTQVDARLNRLEQDANTATFPVEPMQTYRSATEHRLAQGGVSAKEGNMLRMLVTDMSRFLGRCAKQYRRYVAIPYSPGLFQIQHGSSLYQVTQEAWEALRWAPRGTTSQADQQLMMTSSAEAIQLVQNYWGLLPQINQAGGMPAATAWYEAHRMRLETLGIQEWRTLLGENPKRDPALVQTDPNAVAAGQQMMGIQPMQQGGQDPSQMMRQSDGAPTNMPGGNPMIDALGGLH